jgi:hypothetical protein
MALSPLILDAGAVAYLRGRQFIRESTDRPETPVALPPYCNRPNLFDPSVPSQQGE